MTGIGSAHAPAFRRGVSASSGEHVNKTGRATKAAMAALAAPTSEGDAR